MQASRLFQMRLGKSYLLAHTNWVRPDPQLCPRCDEELEIIEHALLTSLFSSTLLSGFTYRLYSLISAAADIALLFILFWFLLCVLVFSWLGHWR
jgi:hypothetical protein